MSEEGCSCLFAFVFALCLIIMAVRVWSRLPAIPPIEIDLTVILAWVKAVFNG